MGLLMDKESRLDEAIVWFKKAVELAPNDTAALNNLASAYSRFESAIVSDYFAYMYNDIF